MQLGDSRPLQRCAGVCWAALLASHNPLHPTTNPPQGKDLSQQVARLVHEVQVLQSGLPAEAAGSAASPGGAGFGGGNASDVTTQRLVEFRDIEVRHVCGVVVVGVDVCVRVGGVRGV